MKTECKASSHEEPGAGIPHAGICAGGARQRASLPRYVTEYLSTNGVIVAHREYDPFGGTVVYTTAATNQQSKVSFTHWVSTKPWCPITCLSEYEFRKYSPPMGRWLSRDPLGDHASPGARTLHGEIAARMAYAALMNLHIALDEELDDYHRLIAVLNALYWIKGVQTLRSGDPSIELGWFDPFTGQWLSIDPIGVSGGLNQHLFCADGPMNVIDAFGLSTIYIKTPKGETKLVDPRLDTLVTKIKEQEAYSITELQITDHGSRTKMDCDGEGSGMTWDAGDKASSVSFTDGFGGVADLLRDRMAKDSTIYLNGCLTASEPLWSAGENISRQLSRELPGVNVKGNVYPAVGNEITPWYLGVKKPLIRFGKSTRVLGVPRVYRNGERKE